MHTYKILFIFLFICRTVYGQEAHNDNKGKIAGILENYFDLEREAIHLHLDKTSFMTHEKIWYKGYVINRKTNKPYFTTNVYIVLYNELGKQLSEKLIYASNGTFEGNIDLSPKLSSGNYYIQAYTNWMNNFTENESTITKINIINPDEGIRDYHKINAETLAISLHPEGGSYVSDVSNIVGVQLKDCRGNAPENIEATVVNSKGELIKTLKLNAFGLGKFEITPASDPLKVVITYNNKVYEKALPIPEPTGFAMEVNNFTIADKTIVKIKTNSTTLQQNGAKKFYLLAHQDQKYIIYDLPMTGAFEQLIPLNNSDLFEGITTLRIIDEGLHQWGERFIYSHPHDATAPITLNKKSAKGSNISLSGGFPYPNSSLSISVLPEMTKSLNDDNNIISGLTVNPYLYEPLAHANYYFTTPSRGTYYALDLALLNQEMAKYDWSYMKTTSPTANYSFDIGLNLKGSIDSQITNKTYHKVKLVSYKDFIMMSSDVDDKGNYLFEHVLLADSTYVSMSLQRLPDFDVFKTKLTPQVINRKKPFYKPFAIRIPENCTDSGLDSLAFDSTFPKFSAGTILLKEVKVIAPVKKRLAHENSLGNGNLRGFKVDDVMERQDLLVFIQSNGFDVVRSGLKITVYSRNRNSLKAAQPTPEISINGRVLFSHDELDMLSMSEIDEIYLSPYAMVPSMKNNMGVIKIYTKKNIPNPKAKQDPNSFYIKEGFARYFGFKNAEYESTQSIGFNNYGLIYWSPTTTCDENGQFNFDIIHYPQTKGKIIFEGMSSEGKVFYEEKAIDLK